MAPPSITAAALLFSLINYMIAAKGLHIKNLRKIYYKKKYKMLKIEQFSAELQEFKVWVKVGVF